MDAIGNIISNQCASVAYICRLSGKTYKHDESLPDARVKLTKQVASISTEQENVSGFQSGEDVKKPGSCSDGPTASTNDHTVVSGEIIEDRCKDTDELHKVVKKSISRIRTRAGGLEESQLIGREKEIAYLNNLISNRDNQQVQVISVYGMGGLGKTTLVDNVYQRQKLGDRFEKCVFVTIMRPFKLVELLRSLAARLHEASSRKEELIERSASTKKTMATMGVEDLIVESGRLLGGKSCLIILDDLSSITEWDQISPVFRQMEKTSRIVVTTREEDIAKHCSGQHGKIHKLQVLEQEEARQLFSEKLQTLDIRDTAIIALPKTITKLRKLQYIHAAVKSDFVPHDSESLTTRGLNRRGACTLACCIALPSIMQSHNGLSGVMVPRGLRKLRDLHTLKDVHVGRGNVVLQDIERLTGLRKLGLAGINKKNGPALCSSLSSLSRLESLSVRSSAGKPGMCGCLDMMSSPPANLQSLKLYGNLETLPEWIKELQHLVKLKLVGTKLSENDSVLKFLGNLPKLDVLDLGSQSFQGEELHFQSPQTDSTFGNLRVLKLAYIGDDSSELRTVKFEVGVMPKLELLQLLLLGVTNEVDISGLEVLPNINEVQLTVIFDIEQEKIRELHASSSQDKIWEEIDQEQKRKEGEYKNKIREQLDKNPNRPVLTWY
ncbi:hypothetical protein EJB05_27540, partial [Eragrostis curvula]